MAGSQAGRSIAIARRNPNHHTTGRGWAEAGARRAADWSDGYRRCAMALSSSWPIIAHRAETDAEGSIGKRSKRRLEQELETRGQYVVTETADQEARVANMSRAYRVNLNMLANGRAVYRNIPGIFDAGVIGRSAPPSIRLAARARTDPQATAGSDFVRRGSPRRHRLAAGLALGYRGRGRRIEFFRRRSGRRVFSRE